MGSRKPRTLSEAIERLVEEGRPNVQDKMATFKALYEELKPYLNDAKETLHAQTAEAVDRGLKAAKKSGDEIDEIVHQQPWLAVGIVGVIALVIGFLIGNRRQ
jgi:ElaB/YqjD/DUF883 family membrane-anchored ribosome-binding protein